MSNLRLIAKTIQYLQGREMIYMRNLRFLSLMHYVGFQNVFVKHLDGRGIQISTQPGKVIRPGDFIKVRNEGMPVKASSS